MTQVTPKPDSATRRESEGAAFVASVIADMLFGFAFFRHWSAENVLILAVGSASVTAQWQAVKTRNVIRRIIGGKS